MEQNESTINLTEILIGHEGDKYWCPLLGDVTYHHSDSLGVHFQYQGGLVFHVRKDGTDILGNLAIFPDRNQYDWIRYDMENNKRRWRAENGDYYYYLDRRFIVKLAYERNSDFDDTNYNTGNYFKTETEGKEVKAKILCLLYEHHKENSITE